MKKLVFTALAVVAFSGAAMAKENVVIQEVFEFNEEVATKEVFGNCEDAQSSAFNEYRSNGCSYWDSYYFGARAWGDCMAEQSF